MLPLSHTYIATKVTGKKTPLLIFGSILPDIATTSSQEIDRDKIHNSPREFYAFVKTKYPELFDLALGVRLHCPADKGADFYSDDAEFGYAKIEGEKINQDVANLLKIEKSAISLILAHNFIELAVDFHLYNNQRDVWETYRTSIENIKDDLTPIAKCLSEYLQINIEPIQKEIYTLIEFLSPYLYASKKTSIENQVLPFIKLLLDKEVLKEAALEILDKALLITKPTYLDYLDKTVVEVKRNIIF